MTALWTPAWAPSGKAVPPSSKQEVRRICAWGHCGVLVWLSAVRSSKTGGRLGGGGARPAPFLWTRLSLPLSFRLRPPPRGRRGPGSFLLRGSLCESARGPFKDRACTNRTSSGKKGSIRQDWDKPSNYGGLVTRRTKEQSPKD